VIHRAIVTPFPSRPLLLTTTDIRTPKADQIHVNANTAATFWFPKSNSQIRVVGSTYLLPEPSHPWHASFAGDMGDEVMETDWDLERVKVFNNISEYLRATFVRPVPGSLMTNYDDAKKWPLKLPKHGEADGEEQKRMVEEALRNFALVVLDPTEVDFLELGPSPDRRTMWTKKGKEWAEHIVVP
jgi:pyridoxamine 5'-phosphate oxidase